ncbi:MAG: protein-disulfide reductase DsbD family protein [Verrucomicrobiaceae bacterium]
MRTRSLITFFTCVVAALSLRAQSISLPGLDDAPKQNVTASLVSEATAAAPGTPFRVAVKLEHAKGAHTYGKELPPEVIGKPTKLQWTLPEGWHVTDLEWPAVHEFKGLDGSPSEGYEGTVYLPAAIIPPANAAIGSKVEIQVNVDGLVCDDKTCMPFKQDAKVTVSVAAEPSVNAAAAAAFEKATAFKVAAILIPEVSTAAAGKPFRVAVQLIHAKGAHTYGKDIAPDKGKPTKLSWTLPEGWTAKELPWPAVQEFELFGEKSNGYLGTVYLPAAITPPAGTKNGMKVKLAVNVDGLVCDDESCTPFIHDATASITVGDSAIPDAAQRAVFEKLPPLGKKSVDAAPVNAGGGEPAATTPPTFLFVMLSAFIGGLILNVMPCVFPVLGIKIVGIVQQAGEDRKQVVLHGLIYTLGILLSFWVLGGFVVALGKGWGFQLQSAGFNFGLAVFFLIFGLNMAGVFEIGASAVGVGANLQAKHGLSGSFFSGLLATLVSTPCSAPFLGTALGFAVKLPAPQAMLLFTLIGLGLASPFLLLSAFPKLVKALPRPGAWMESFKQGMSFLLFGTVLYMLWVLTGMVDGLPLLALMLGLALVALGCWIYGRWSLPHKPAKTRGIAVVLTLAAVIGGLTLGWPQQSGEKKHVAVAVLENGLLWEPWSEAKVQELISAGKPVYIDFTAKWCLTCQVNKRVYRNPDIQELFKKHGVVAVKADYTNEDEAIKKAFTALGRGAVPVNVLYIPGVKEPHVLPEILTADNVTAALRKLEK